MALMINEPPHSALTRNQKMAPDEATVNTAPAALAETAIWQKSDCTTVKNKEGSDAIIPE